MRCPSPYTSRASPWFTASPGFTAVSRLPQHLETSQRLSALLRMVDDRCGVAVWWSAVEGPGFVDRHPHPTHLGQGGPVLPRGINHHATGSEPRLRHRRPDAGLTAFQPAVRPALQRIHDRHVTTSWSSAITAGAPSDPLPSDPEWAGGSLYIDERKGLVDATPDQLWSVIEGIGGEHGWYSWRLGWWARGLLDRIFDTDVQGRTLFRQRALFHPRGLAGHIYWAVIRPFHGVVFGGMQRNIARAAEGLRG